MKNRIHCQDCPAAPPPAFCLHCGGDGCLDDWEDHVEGLTDWDWVRFRLAEVDGVEVSEEAFENWDVPDNAEDSSRYAVDSEKLFDFGEEMRLSVVASETGALIGDLNSIVAQEWAKDVENSTICVGMARMEGGLWKCHVWVVRDGKLFETTGCVRQEYFGYGLDLEESLDFFFCEYLLEINENAALAIADCAQRYPHVLQQFRHLTRRPRTEDKEDAEELEQVVTE